MIGRALEGDVHREVHATLLARLRQVFEIGNRSELRMHGPVAAVCGADGPWAPIVSWCSDDVVVRAFAEGRSDRMNGREIKDVESHVRDLG